MSMDWRGTDQNIRRGMDEHERKYRYAMEMVANYFKAVFERDAKANAPWTDRTAIARAGLWSDWEWISDEIIQLWLSHSVDYGIYLETRFAGQYAIIWPTIQENLQAIENMLREVFG